MNRLLCSITLGLALTTSAWGIPTLQLDASNGIYDTATESTANTGNTFTLYALLNSTSLTGKFYVTAAIVPQASGDFDFGSFTFAGKLYDSTDDLLYGTPSLMPGHGVFPTYYLRQEFTFSSLNTTNAYNVTDVQGTHTGPGQVEGGSMLYMPFEVDLSGLNADTTLAFDLFTYTTSSATSPSAKRQKNTVKLEFAPFSHNALGSPKVNVPDSGTTAILLGIALLGAVGTDRVVRRGRRVQV